MESTLVDFFGDAGANHSGTWLSCGWEVDLDSLDSIQKTDTYTVHYRYLNMSPHAAQDGTGTVQTVPYKLRMEGFHPSAAVFGFPSAP